MEEKNISPVNEDEKEVKKGTEEAVVTETKETNINKTDIIETDTVENEEDSDNIDELREQARLKAEKQQQKIREKELKSGKKCRIAGIIAAVAGVLEVYFGFSAGSATSMCIGVAFICAGYYYYNMGKRLDRKYHVS